MSRIFCFLFIVIEEDAECSWASVARNRSLSFMDDDFLEAELLKTVICLIKKLFVDLGVGHEHSSEIRVLIGGESFLKIIEDPFVFLAAELLSADHFSIRKKNLRAELQEVGTKHCKSVASPSLIKIID